MFDFLIDIVPREEFKMGKESKAGGATAAAAAAVALGEHRRSQESFPSIGSNAAGVVPSGLHPAGLEGYPYAYGMLEGSYMVRKELVCLFCIVFVCLWCYFSFSNVEKPLLF